MIKLKAPYFTEVLLV